MTAQKAREITDSQKITRISQIIPLIEQRAKDGFDELIIRNDIPNETWEYFSGRGYNMSVANLDKRGTHNNLVIVIRW